MTNRAMRQAKRRAARKGTGASIVHAIRARRAARKLQRAGAVSPLAAGAPMPADSAATGRLTLVIGRDAYAELKPAAKAEGMTPAGLAGRMLRECLA